MTRHNNGALSRCAATLMAVVLTYNNPVVHAVRLLPGAQRSAANQVISSIVHQQHSNVSDHRHLASVSVPMPASPADHLVTNLPLLPEGTLTTPQWAGLLPASDEGDKYLFYWLFAPDLSTTQNQQLQDTDIPLVIWLNGGPGCSSMDGLFLENGPLRFEKKESDGTYELVASQTSWHKTPAYMLYIDQPVGTGLAFTTSRKYPKNDREVNIDFYHFLQSFLTVHSDKFVVANKLNRPFYMSGESHAGHYIPSMLAFILDQNDANNDHIYIPVSGAAIGNGWVDPFHQYAAAEAAYGHGIIGRAQMTALAEKEKECQALLNQKRYASSVCFNLLDDIVGQSYGSKSNFKVSQYDVRKVESRRGARTFPPGHKTVETYLGGTGSAEGMTSATMTQALEALHATPSRTAGQVYQECTNPPYDALSHQDGLGVVNEVVKVLEHEKEGEDKVRLLFFNGVTDLICNHVGNEIMLENLPWKKNEAYIQSARSAWKSKSQPGDHISGYIKEFENLLYLKVMDSGHMVPMDVPDVALDMVRLFLYGGANAFQYSPQSLHRAVDNNDQCPTCPTCPTNITNYDIGSIMAASQQAGSADQGITSNKASIAVGLALGCAMLFFSVVMIRRSRYAKHNPVTATYDLEMRGGTYFDDPAENGNGETANGGSSTGKFH